MAEFEQPERRPRALALLGPTAIGKSALAYALAEELPITVISVDSAQIYRRMDIGTGKPSAEEQARVPHRLIDLREPWESYSAAEFVSDAMAEIAQAHRDGRLPVLVGGTHLYFRALARGLSPLPAADPALRTRLAEELAERGAEEIHQRLRTLDPLAAERIHPNDPQRLLRALEVIELSGKRLSEQQNQRPDGGLPLLACALLPDDRHQLHQRIAQRLDAMLAAGFLAEVEALAADPRNHDDSPAMRSVGYRQLLAHLNGEWDLAEARDRAIYATRQLAKRQLTWLRKEPAVETLPSAAALARLHQLAARIPIEAGPD
ncbi:MAG: tRNA (adenosine(37)-N6)-dimethylallyltransferase MiaA [Xanthomonadales bacterium]|nr:tRNA (adenosine(37)-N6)-dimethylallyltransferase MiaA [Xanthomonadales bacterium]